MTDLQKRIEELEEVANDSTIIIKKKYIKNDIAVNLCKDMAKQALSIIKQLQEEADKHKLLWETACEGAKAIIAEQEQEIKQLKEKLNDK